MKKILLLLVVLLGGIFGAQAQIETLTTKGFWGNNSSYTGTQTSSKTFLDSKWTAFGFNNNNSGWNNIRCGSNKNEYTAYISSNSQISNAISYFEINTAYEQSAEAKKLASFKLYISDNAQFTDAAEVSYSDCTTGGDWVINIPADQQGVNKYYKFAFECPKANSKNGYFSVNSIKAYAPEGDVKNVVISYEMEGAEAVVTLTTPTEGATIYYGTSEEAITTEYTEPFRISENCTIYAKAIKDSDESQVTNLTIDLPYTSFKDAIANSVDKETLAIIGNFEVIYTSGDCKYLLITDGTSNILAYFSKAAENTYEVGDKFTEIKGTASPFNNLFEIISFSATKGGDGATAPIIEVNDLSTINYTDNIFDKVLIKGCTISSMSADGKQANIELGDNTVLLRDVFSIDFQNGENYDITGFVWRNNNDLQIAPILIEGGEAKETVKTPVIKPNVLELHENQLITITCDTEDSTIYYTTDGSDPTQESIKYTEPFSFTESCTIKARAYYEGNGPEMFPSDVAERTYRLFDPTCNVISTEDHDYTGNYQKSHTCTIDGVDYQMVGMHNKDQGIQMNPAQGCYVIQTGENEGYVVSSVVVEFSSNTNNFTFTVRGANTPFVDNETESNIKTNGVEIGTISNSNLTVEFPKDYKYFSFYPNGTTSKAVYMNSITINYREPAAIVAAPVLSDDLAAEFDSDEEALYFPEIPTHEDWTAMYQVNDGEELEIDPTGTIHEEALDAATLHTIKIWYEHYNLTDKSEVKTYYHLSAPRFTVTPAQNDDSVTTIDFGTIGEGVAIYFTLNGETPEIPESNAAKAPARASATDGVYHIDSAADLNDTHTITAATPQVQIHALPEGTVVNLSTIASHAESGISSRVKQSEGAIGVPTGVEEIEAVEDADAVYFNLQGVSIAKPEKGAYIRVINGKAQKVIK